MMGFGVTFLNRVLETGVVLNLVISVAAVHAKFEGKAAFSFLLG